MSCQLRLVQTVAIYQAATDMIIVSAVACANAQSDEIIIVKSACYTGNEICFKLFTLKEGLEDMKSSSTFPSNPKPYSSSYKIGQNLTQKRLSCNILYKHCQFYIYTCKLS